MLPDLRIVIAAVLSTFVLTAGVGFYASSRLIDEPRKSTDSIAALDATPVNRIALSWPAPARQSEPLALDFAVTAKALRNPVRDVTAEFPPPEPEPQAPPVRTSATDLAVPPAEAPSARPPEAAMPEPTPPVPTEAVAVASETPKPVPEPDIRVAVLYPPIPDLPQELQAPIIPAAPAIAALENPATAPATTGSVAEPAQSAETESDPVPPPAKEPDVEIASRPEPDDARASNDRAIEIIPMPKAAPKLKPAKVAPKKKAAPKRVVRRPVRRAAPVVPAPVPNFFNMFTLQQPR